MLQWSNLWYVPPHSPTRLKMSAGGNNTVKVPVDSPRVFFTFLSGSGSLYLDRHSAASDGDNGESWFVYRLAYFYCYGPKRTKHTPKSIKILFILITYLDLMKRRKDSKTTTGNAISLCFFSIKRSSLHCHWELPGDNQLLAKTFMYFP